MFKKINTKTLIPKVLGLGVGTVGAGYISKMLDKLNLPPMIKGVAMIGVGALAPGLIGKTDQMIISAGDAVISQGVRDVAKAAGLNISGPYDELGDVGDIGDESDVSGLDDLPMAADGRIVSGPDDEMSGVGDYNEHTA